MTEKLYEQDAFLVKFEAKVVSCVKGKKGFDVILDRTAFYPEGGGQPYDTGRLEVAGTRDKIKVLKVHSRDGEVVHTCNHPLEEGTTVAGVIDWDRRFDLMQQHSGEHIVSGLAHYLWGCENVGFHLGTEVVTIDLDRPLTQEQFDTLERTANWHLWQINLPVQITYPSSEELEHIHYRSKKELTGRVRIVEFPGADCCACCGTHVLRAGQVGLVKVISCQKFREGVRLEILCGGRAAEYLSAVFVQNRIVAQRLSVKPKDTAAAVERLEEELSAAKIRQAELEEQVFAAIARESAGRGDVLLFQPGMRPDSVRRLADAVARQCGGLAAVFAGEDGRYAYALVRADGAEISGLVREMNGALNGRGGGRSGFAQGSVQAPRDKIEAFFAG